VLEDTLEIDLLLEVAPEGHARLLSDDSDDALVVLPSVIEAVEQVDRPGAGGRDAHAELTGELGVRGRHERRNLRLDVDETLEARARRRVAGPARTGPGGDRPSRRDRRPLHPALRHHRGGRLSAPAPAGRLLRPRRPADAGHGR